MTDFSFFEFYSAEVWAGRRLNVRCRYGGSGTGAASFIDTKGGGGVWEVVKRPYLEPLTVWRGPTEAYTHKIPALLDGWSDGKDVGQAVEEVELMAGVLSGHPLIEPPQLILNGYGAIRHDYIHNPNYRWVIPEPPEWGEPVRDKDGRLVRQAFTLSFMLYNSDQTLRREPTKAPHRPHHRAKAGDTFESIAARPRGKGGLGHAHWGTRLANLNGRQHALERLHPGQEILMPDKQEEREWERSRRR